MQRTLERRERESSTTTKSIERLVAGCTPDLHVTDAVWKFTHDAIAGFTISRRKRIPDGRQDKYCNELPHRAKLP